MGLVKVCAGQRPGSTVYVENGYYYHVKKRGKRSLNLRCSHSKCPVRATTASKEEERDGIRITLGTHNHGPEELRERVRRFRLLLMERSVSDPTTPIRQIFNEEAVNVPEIVASTINFTSVRRSMCRVRAAAHGPQVPPREPPGEYVGDYVRESEMENGVENERENGDPLEPLEQENHSNLSDQTIREEEPYFEEIIIDSEQEEQEENIIPLSPNVERIPVDLITRKKWLQQMNIKQKDYKPSMVVCSSHFKKSDYVEPGSPLLKRGTVPSLLLGKNAILKTSPKKVKLPDRIVRRLINNKESAIKQNITSSKPINSVETPKKQSADSIKQTKKSLDNVSLKKKEDQTNSNGIQHAVNVRKTTNSQRITRNQSVNPEPASKKARIDTGNQKVLNKSEDNQSVSVLSAERRYWTSIQETITEMKEKIKSLELKSIQDEQKIDNLQNKMFHQKQQELKALIEGKENEIFWRADILSLDYNPKRMCRLCLLEKNGPLIPLFQPKPKTYLLEKILKWTGIKVKNEDGIPNSICYECSIQMERAEWFKKRSEQADSLIKNFMHIKSNAKTVSSREEEVDQPNTKIEIEDVFTLENSSDENLDFHDNVDYEIEIKEEKLDEGNVSVATSDVRTHETDHSENLKVFRTKKKMCTKCDVPVQMCSNKEDHVLKCCECEKKFWSRCELNKHRALRYKCFATPVKRTCNICDCVFRWKWQLNIHLWQHHYVKFHTCKICEEQFMYIDQLKSHIATHFC